MGIRRQGPRQYSKPPTYIWRPCIPSWEREFTLKIGNFAWKSFVEAKKYVSFSDKILKWNDSAGEEAFNVAKKQFYNQYFNKSSNKSDQIVYDPDMYIDEIIDSDPNSQESNDEDPMISISDVEEEILKNEGTNEMNVMVPLLGAEVIKPTGWDVDIPETTDLLTGLIVGEDGVDDDNVLQDRLNIEENLLDLKKFHRIV